METQYQRNRFKRDLLAEQLENAADLIESQTAENEELRFDNTAMAQEWQDIRDICKNGRSMRSRPQRTGRACTKDACDHPWRPAACAPVEYS